jgi:DNA-directed RNA polymerase specialized sigma24 family protein
MFCSRSIGRGKIQYVRPANRFLRTGISPLALWEICKPMESPEVMQAFLLWLGADEASGARKYEDIRRKLTLLFRYRGCHIPEELADETIDRTARAALKPDFQYQGDPIAYFRGVAHNVYHEWLRKERKFRSEPLEGGYIDLPAPDGGAEQDDPAPACLDRCLNALSPPKKNLLIRYYGSDKRAKIDGRQLLADELGIALNALRIQVFRLRNGLRECIEICKERGDILPR